MKLAEALSERADIQKRMAQLRQRLRMNARVQEGEKPAEEPEKLIAELEALCSRQEELIRRINLTNALCTDEGESITALLARRDVLRERVSIMQSFLSEASDTVSRATRTEIAIKSTVNVASLQKRTDDLSGELRQLDVRIQGLNWTADLQ